jgi:hypothetical protein
MSDAELEKEFIRLLEVHSYDYLSVRSEADTLANFARSSRS